MRKELTFVVPSYNMEMFLPKCLESLGIDQLRKETTVEGGTLADFLEVIVVNDGSQDSTSVVAHQFERRFPEVVRVIDKTNGNYGSCVNVALQVATGRYIRMLDADDYLEANELAKYLRFVLSLDGGADLVVNDYDEIESTGKVFRVMKFMLPSNNLFPMDLLVKSNEMLGNYSIAYRREILIKMGYCQSEGISYTDTEWHTLPMLYVATVSYRPGVLMHYLIERNGQSMEAERFIRNINMLEQIARRLIRDFENCRNMVPQAGAIYAGKRILALLQLIYTMVLVGYKGIRAKFDLLGFDRWLKSTSREFYDEMENQTWFTKCPFHYVAEWRRHHTDRTWRYCLFRIVLKMCKILAIK